MIAAITNFINKLLGCDTYHLQQEFGREYYLANLDKNNSPD
jgi:hypothetical protein